MLKKTLVIRASVLMFSVFLLSALGCPNTAASKGQPNPNPNPDPKPLPGEIPENLRLHSIEASVKGVSAYKPVENFNSKMEGPYAAEDAETAYITFRVKPSEKLAEEAGGVSIFAENMNTYIPKEKLKKNLEYFISKALPLSKGVNMFVITINGAQTYKITVNYAGGPESNGNRIIPGIYCPAQRKPSQGEKEEFVWGMFLEYGGKPVLNLLAAAGKDGKIYEKYKEKGLRIVIIGTDSVIKNVKDQGLNLPVYSRENNILKKFFKFNGFPEDVYIVEGKRKGGNLGPKPVNEYEPIIKKVFGF